MSDPTLVRSPDATTVEAVLSAIDPASADTDPAPALSAAFPRFSFSIGAIDDLERIEAIDAEIGLPFAWFLS